MSYRPKCYYNNYISNFILVREEGDIAAEVQNWLPQNLEEIPLVVVEDAQEGDSEDEE